MYSQQMLRVNHDEWLRYAATRRLLKQAAAEASEYERPSGRTRPQRRRLGALGVRRRISHA